MVSSCLAVLRKYAVFRGRTRRREFWLFTLACFLSGILLTIWNCFNINSPAYVLVNSINLLIAFGIIVPSICVTIRRLHDTGRGSLWLALIFIPLVGVLILTFALCFDSEPGENKFGPNPKEAFASNPLVA